MAASPGHGKNWIEGATAGRGPECELSPAYCWRRWLLRHVPSARMTLIRLFQKTSSKSKPHQGQYASSPSTRRRGGSCSQPQGSQVCACTSSRAASPQRGETAPAHIGTILAVRLTSTWLTQ